MHVVVGLADGGVWGAGGAGLVLSGGGGVAEASETEGSWGAVGVVVVVGR